MSIPSESEESPFDIASKAGKKQTIFLYRKTLKKADFEQVELHGKIKFYNSVRRSFFQSASRRDNRTALTHQGTVPMSV